MSWSINIPHRLRSDSLSDVAVAAGVLPTDEERVVCRQLVLGEITGGSTKTAGELMDKLEKASPEERRGLLDRARTKAGLEDTRTVEGRRQMEQASFAGRLHSASETRPLRLAIKPGGARVDLNEAEDAAARERERQASRERIRNEHDGQRSFEARQMEASERDHAAAIRSELPPGVPG